MKSQNKGTAFHKWSRIIHRDLSFFFAGMILIYAISGIVMNHRDSINPHYTVTRTEYKITEDLSDKSKVNEKMILTLLEPLGEAGNFTKYYYPKPDRIKVFLKGGSSLVINTRTKDAVYEGVKRRPLISSMVQLHFNPGKWWTWFADAFAVCLIIITVSGIVMIKGPKGLWGRGGIELVAGILIPILFLACKNLTHYYGQRKIYENLSFEVPQGCILGLLGKNGTGKTTTINILSGYLQPRSGECRIFGENIQTMNPALRRNIGLLLEGHVQYQFMNITQIEKFYASFYPGQWKKEAYYDLMNKLKVAPGQRISRMSNGQRSQVALGLILAQNPELLILDDFSLGLDPGYRRLFVDYLRDYARSENKTVFLTSHIIQDMERLIDDCIIMDYGSILIQQPIETLMKELRRYTCTVPEGYQPQLPATCYHPAVIRQTLETYSFLPPVDVEKLLKESQVPFTGLQHENVSLEDAFIGLTGKY